jgi:alcohol dehydrogenase class IV
MELSMFFEFSTANRIIFRPGGVENLGDIASEFGKKCLLIASANGSRVDKAVDLLEKSGVKTVVFSVSGEPTVDMVLRGVERGLSEQVELVASFGGGSVIDTGKAISALLTNPGDIYDFLEVIGKGLPIQKKPLPFIAIPTTAGTGSEVTRNAVLILKDQKVKVSLRSSMMIPTVALVDPELTLTVPPAVTAATGMDALCQVIEPYVSKKANCIVDMFCENAIPRAASALLRAYQNGEDREARIDMAWVSLLGGLSLANAGLGAVHGFAGPIGGMFNAPHGAVCARLLPVAMEVNIQAMQERESENISLNRYKQIARLVTGDHTAGYSEGIAWIYNLCQALNIPGLGQFGITEQDIPEIINKAQAASSMKANPIQLRGDELIKILKNAL